MNSDILPKTKASKVLLFVIAMSLRFLLRAVSKVASDQRLRSHFYKGLMYNNNFHHARVWQVGSFYSIASAAGNQVSRKNAR